MMLFSAICASNLIFRARITIAQVHIQKIHTHIWHTAFDGMLFFNL